MDQEHRCQCWKCKPGAYPHIPETPFGMDEEMTPYMRSSHPRNRPGPVWATAQRLGFQDGKIAVYLNGVAVDEYGWGAMEVLFGSPGWLVYEQMGIPHRIIDTMAPRADLWTQCQCGSGQACLQVAFGLVTTEAVPDRNTVRSAVVTEDGIVVTKLCVDPGIPGGWRTVMDWR